MPRFRSSPPPWWSAADGERPVKLVRKPRAILARFLVAALLTVPLLGMLLANPGLNPTNLSGGGLRQPPTLRQLSQGCTGVSRWPAPPVEEVGSIPGGLQDFAWRLSPPVSGNFAADPYTGPRFIPADADQLLTPQAAVGVLYRGGTVLWYLPSADPEDLETLLPYAADFLTVHPDLVIAPWPIDPEGTWSKGRQFIFTQWRTTLVCSTFDDLVLEEFMDVPRVAPRAFTSLDAPAPAAKVRTIDTATEQE